MDARHFRDLQVVIALKFGRMRNGCHLAALFPLGLDEVLQQNLGEDTTGSQISVIGFQSVQSGFQRSRQALQLLLLFLGQVVQVHVVGTPAVLVGIDPVLDAVAKIVSAESPLWSGTATELVALLGIDMKPNQLSVKLNINAQRLWKERNVRYHNSRTHAGRKIDLQLILPEA